MFLNQDIGIPGMVCNFIEGSCYGLLVGSAENPIRYDLYGCPGGADGLEQVAIEAYAGVGSDCLVKKLKKIGSSGSGLEYTGISSGTDTLKSAVVREKPDWTGAQCSITVRGEYKDHNGAHRTLACTIYLNSGSPD